MRKRSPVPWQRWPGPETSSSGSEPERSANGRTRFPRGLAFTGPSPAPRNNVFPDLTASLLAAAPDLRGRLLANVMLSDLTWLRAGGPAQLLFTPAGEEDLAYFLSGCPPEIPVT